MKTTAKSVTECETCFQIACRACEWIAIAEEVELIQQGLLTQCPLCGWIPGKDK